MLKPFLNQPSDNECRPQEISRLATAILLCVVSWVFLPSFKAMVSRWSTDPQYSHGFFIPILAAMIAWHRKDRFSAIPTRPHWHGILFVAAGVGAYLLGARIYFDWIQYAALLPILYGVALIVGGVWCGRVTWPAVLFLLFMIPLPFFVETAMARPLQSLAGQWSTFLLQTCGIAAIRTGNLINVEGHVLGVAEACSGLRMLVVFFAIAAAVAIFMERSWIQKLILIASAVPIALICNVLRITVTGMLYVSCGAEVAERVFHDVAGWLMMPLALGMMWLELKYLSRLIDDSWGVSAVSGERSASVFATPVHSEG